MYNTASVMSENAIDARTKLSMQCAAYSYSLSIHLVGATGPHEWDLSSTADRPSKHQDKKDVDARLQVRRVPRIA